MHALSHDQENCLNCGEPVQGKFCSNCGQEVHQHKYNFWGMVKHFVFDLLHFEGKFFLTLKLLLLKPGRPAIDYVSGKKASYFDPVKMYLFISAFTFFIFPFILNFKGPIEDIHILATPSERLSEASRQYESIQNNPGPESTKKFEVLLNHRTQLLLRPSSDTTKTGIGFQIDGKDYKAIPVSDSLLFPERNWLERKISRNMKEKYTSEGENINRIIELQTKLQFKILPYVFFLSLPLFAFILKGIYNKRKDYYFSDHSIFTLYHYVVLFFILLINLLLGAILRSLDINPLFLLYIPSLILVSFYLLIGMKRFYKDRWSKTLVTFLMVSIFSLLGFILLYLLLITGSLLV